MYAKTERLVLRPILETSLESLAALFTDDTVKQTYMVPDFPHREAAVKFAGRIRQLSLDPGRYVAGIYLDTQLIGLMNETEVSGDSIEVGYAILPQFQNRGYCTEALVGAIAYFFDRGFSQVIAGAFEENAASLRVMEKSGMLKIQKTDEAEYRGKTHRCVYYAAQRP